MNLKFYLGASIFYLGFQNYLNLGIFSPNWTVLMVFLAITAIENVQIDYMMIMSFYMTIYYFMSQTWDVLERSWFSSSVIFGVLFGRLNFAPSLEVLLWAEIYTFFDTLVWLLVFVSQNSRENGQFLLEKLKKLAIFPWILRNKNQNSNWGGKEWVDLSPD